MERKRRIVHIVEAFGGGAFEFIRNIVNGVKAYEHTIVYGIRKETPQNFRDYIPEVCEFYFWKSAQREISPFKDLKALVELLIILKRIEHYDIVHLHSSKAGFLGRLVCRVLGCHSKVVYSPHGIAFLRKDVSKLKVKLFIFLEKLANKFGGRVVAVSKSEMDEIIKNGIDAIFIYPGIDCRFKVEDLDNEKGIITIGTVGRLTIAKSPSLFNEIAHNFLEEIKLIFLWVGDGELRNHLTAPNIHVTGWVSHEKVFEYLKEIDIYISTSLWEGLPLASLEAMCMGKPLVLSNCIGHRDLVVNGYNGFLFNSVDEAISSIKELIGNKNKIKKYGESSRKIFIEKFTLDEMIKGYKKLYDSISQ